MPDDFEALKAIIFRQMQKYPHGDPHPETVEALAQGLFSVIAVSNARPEKYKDEPWLEQPVDYHAAHAEAHAETSRREWVSDLGQPEIAHCCMRSMFCMYLHKKGSR